MTRSGTRFLRAFSIVSAIAACSVVGHAEEPAAALAPSGDPKAVEPATSGATASSLKTHVGGFVQADAVLLQQSSHDELDGSTGEPLNQSRFLIRRARIRLDLERSFVWAGLELDTNTINGMHGGLTEADVGVIFRGRVADAPATARATLGLFKIPFGAEGPELDTARLFLERSSMSRAFFPGTFDLGAGMDGAFGPLRYAIAVMNGNPINDVLFPARDPNAAKDIVGRLGVDAEVTPSVRFRMGFSMLQGTGFHPGTPSTKDVLVWRDVNEDGRVELSELQDISGSAATASQNFDRFAVGSDMRLTAALPWLGALTLMGEITVAKNLDRGLEPADPVSLGRDVREVGWVVGVTQEITRYGMLGVRYDRYNPDLDGAGQQGIQLVPQDSSWSTLALAAALRYAPGRLVIEYDRNGNALGRTRAGLPTTLADNQLAVRGEVVF